MEKRNVDILDDDTDELEEALEAGVFNPAKPRPTQFIPMVLFLCLFLLLGADFFVRNEIGGKWTEMGEISDSFTAVFVCPQGRADSALLEETKAEVMANRFLLKAIDTRNDTTADLAAIHGIILLVSDKQRLEPILYSHRNEPHIKGLAVGNRDETVWNIIRMKWQRLLMAISD